MCSNYSDVKPDPDGFCKIVNKAPFENDVEAFNEVIGSMTHNTSTLCINKKVNKLIISGDDKGLSNDDIDRLSKFCVTSEKGLGEHGYGGRAGGIHFVKKADEDTFTIVSYQELNKEYNGIRYRTHDGASIQYQLLEAEESKKLFHQHTSKKLVKKYTTTWIIPIKEEFKLEEIINGCKCMFNKKISKGDFKIYFDDSELKVESFYGNLDKIYKKPYVKKDNKGNESKYYNFYKNISCTLFEGKKKIIKNGEYIQAGNKMFMIEVKYVDGKKEVYNIKEGGRPELILDEQCERLKDIIHIPNVYVHVLDERTRNKMANAYGFKNKGLSGFFFMLENVFISTKPNFTKGLRSTGSDPNKTFHISFNLTRDIVNHHLILEHVKSKKVKPGTKIKKIMKALYQVFLNKIKKKCQCEIDPPPASTPTPAANTPASTPTPAANTPASTPTLARAVPTASASVPAPPVAPVAPVTLEAPSLPSYPSAPAPVATPVHPFASAAPVQQSVPVEEEKKSGTKQKPGNFYGLFDSDRPLCLKAGITEQDYTNKKILKKQYTQRHFCAEPEIIAWAKVENMHLAEQNLFHLLRHYIVNERGEAPSEWTRNCPRETFIANFNKVVKIVGGEIIKLK